MTSLDRNEILPSDPDLEILHDREYRVRAFRKDPNLLLRGSVRDQKPPHLYIVEDPNPLTIHHMQIDLEVGFPSLEIVAAAVHFEVFPHDTCTHIIEHYDDLVGLSIARGFTHKVRELFGGPRGCTHTTALLQAMGPVAVQSTWSMRAAEQPAEGVRLRRPRSPEERRQMFASNLNTCHVWAEDGEHVAAIDRGDEPEMPVWMVDRMAKLGIDLTEMTDRWRA